MLKVEEEGFIIDQMKNMYPKQKKKFDLPKNPFLSTLIKLKRMKLVKEENENRAREESEERVRK